MDIAEFLDAPNGAVLVAINGGVELVTIRHETPTRTILERFPLGQVVNVDAVLALLDHAQRAPAVRAPTIAAPRETPQARPALAAPTPDRPYPCSTCDKRFKRGSELIRHQRAVHGMTERDLVCPTCGHLCLGTSGLAIHQAKKHGDAPVTPAAPAPVSLDPAPLLGAVVTPQAGPPIVRAVPSDPRGVCDTCGMPNRNHLACEECARRIGPGHTVEAPARQRGGKVWCESCVEVLRQQTAHSGKAARV